MMFGDHSVMKQSDNLDWFALERLYDEGRKLFLRGKHEVAIARFKRIYMDTLDMRDVTEIVEDYYELPRGQWVAKYRTRFERLER